MKNKTYLMVRKFDPITYREGTVYQGEGSFEDWEERVKGLWGRIMFDEIYKIYEASISKSRDGLILQKWEGTPIQLEKPTNPCFFYVPLCPNFSSLRFLEDIVNGARDAVYESMAPEANEK